MGRSAFSHYNFLGGDMAPVPTLTGGVRMDSQDIKDEFARRLQTAMMRHGWNQSELARRASECLPKPEPGQKRGHEIGRDLISHYVRGKMLPLPVNMAALAKALGVKPEDLMPSGVPSVGGASSPFEMKGLPDGRMYLRINRTVSQDTAMKIMSLLAEEDRQSGALQS